MDQLLQDELNFLLEKTRAGQASSEDYKKLVEFVNSDQSGAVIGRIDSFLADGQAEAPDRSEPYDYEYWQQAFGEMKQAFQTGQTQPAVVRRMSPLRRWWAAAGVVLVIAVGAWWWTGQKTAPTPAVASVSPDDIPPGREGAILTLADGSQVLLDTIQNTTIALQGGAVAKVVNGSLVYESNGNEVVYNTVSTPKGRQFQLVLPDGSQVWLNSASAIRYPTVFAGDERKVEIEGEVYFEVAKNEKKPFSVIVSNNMKVEVVGTHFNINAYRNEANISTTLIEGNVKVNGAMISAGQQAQIDRSSDENFSVKIIPNADTAKAIAWKNGLFNFQNATLEEILRQLERWYDIEIVYEKGVPDIELTGEMTRNISLNTLLRLLKDMGLEYRKEGEKLVVLPSKHKTK